MAIAKKKKTVSKTKAVKKISKPAKTVAKKVYKTKSSSDKSFKMINEQHPFMTFKITDQTIYWSILFIVIMALSLWVLNIQIDTIRILDRIQL